MSAEGTTWLAIISDDGETDIRDTDIVDVVALDGRRSEILEDEGITDANESEFTSLPSISVGKLIAIAEAAANYRKAEVRGQSLEWLAEAQEWLDNDLVETGFLFREELSDG